MIRRFALLIVGIVALSALAWWFVADDDPEPAPKPTAPSQVDKIIAFCAKADNETNPLCTVDPDDSEAVRDAVRDAIEHQTTGPQIIERERITERGDDSDSDAPDVRVIVPRQTTGPTARPTTRPTTPAPARTTRPPLVQDIEIPKVPEVPKAPPVPRVPVPDLPLP